MVKMTTIEIGLLRGTANSDEAETEAYALCKSGIVKPRCLEKMLVLAEILKMTRSRSSNYILVSYSVEIDVERVHTRSASTQSVD